MTEVTPCDYSKPSEWEDPDLVSVEFTSETGRLTPFLS